MPAPKTPQDHKAKADKAAAKSEAENKVIEVDFDGEHYAIDRIQADNLELMEFVEDEQYIKALRGYLGREQWDRWKDSQRTEDGRVPMAPFEDFLNRIMEAIGGNSSGSATS
jgi:hypothetical protein